MSTSARITIPSSPLSSSPSPPLSSPLSSAPPSPVRPSWFMHPKKRSEPDDETDSFDVDEDADEGACPSKRIKTDDDGGDEEDGDNDDEDLPRDVWAGPSEWKLRNEDGYEMTIDGDSGDFDAIQLAKAQIKAGREKDHAARKAAKKAARKKDRAREKRKALEMERAAVQAWKDEQERFRREEEKKAAQREHEEEQRKLELENKFKNQPKKVIYAKKPEWNDIPDWGNSTTCPLMKLPGELMDLCFGYTAGQPNISIADYVALAGSSKYFRHHLNDDFFNEMCDDQKVGRHGSRYYYRMEDAPTTRIASQPFTRRLEDWREDPARIKIPTPTTKSFYVPPGPRYLWTEAMHWVHEEERMKWREAEAEKIFKSEAQLAEQREERRINSSYFNSPRGLGSILAMIPGREDGQANVQKDRKGIPLKVQIPMPQKDGTEESHVEVAAARLWASVTGRPIDECPDPNAVARAARKLWNSTIWAIDKKKILHERVKKSIASPYSDPPIDDKDLPFKIDYDYYGRKVPFDYWPSDHREAAAEHVNSMFLNKTVSSLISVVFGLTSQRNAISKYKVSEAELISLRHFLVTNHMNSNNPKQKFFKRAVESLAYRSHGGIQGHADYVERLEAAAAKAAATRLEKKKQGFADGTYDCRPPACSCPHWWYGECVCYYDVKLCDVCDRFHT